MEKRKSIPQVRMDVGQHHHIGEPTFNGLSRAQIINSYPHDLNLY